MFKTRKNFTAALIFSLVIVSSVIFRDQKDLTQMCLFEINILLMFICIDIAAICDILKNKGDK